MESKQVSNIHTNNSNFLLNIPLTVDKSHILTIGEKLYSHSLDLIRELVNNAYDADAENVYIKIDKEKIIVQDDGTGMDLEGLRNYFNIGSKGKIFESISPIFKRERIGQFGIGKFAVLTISDKFEIMTKKGEFKGKVIFDRYEWEKDENNWSVPFQILNIEKKEKDGTTIIIYKPKYRFNPDDVERKIIEGCPLKVKKFSVYLNNKKIKPKSIAGQNLAILEGTKYGIIHGTIIISSKEVEENDKGISCKVKGATIKKINLFNNSQDNFITGELNVDFIPITADRSNFKIDTRKYKAFLKKIEIIKQRLIRILKAISDEKENKRISKAIKDVVEKVEDALLKNPHLCPEFLWAGISKKQQKKLKNKNKNKIPMRKIKIDKKEKQPNIRIHNLTTTALIKRVKRKNLGITYIIDHFGDTSPEAFTENTIIYINRDHPLYKKESKKKEALIRHIARLLTQEISLMNDPENPRKGFELQSTLLKDIFIESKE